MFIFRVFSCKKRTDFGKIYELANRSTIYNKETILSQKRKQELKETVAVCKCITMIAVLHFNRALLL